jgi:hypothetical protein
MPAHRGSLKLLGFLLGEEIEVGEPSSSETVPSSLSDDSAAQRSRG